jgi:hypothetical protein
MLYRPAYSSVLKKQKAFSQLRLPPFNDYSLCHVDIKLASTIAPSSWEAEARGRERERERERERGRLDVHASPFPSLNFHKISFPKYKTEREAGYDGACF